jgi:hypothetical protein
VIRVFVDSCGEALFKNPLFLVPGDAMGVCVKEIVLEVTFPSPVDFTSKVIDLRLERCRGISSVTPDEPTRCPCVKGKCHV